MKILVRLPNWLGDMVMSVGFLNQLPYFFPGAEISVIAKKGIHQLLDFFPATERQFLFSKEDYPGIKGPYMFGRMIRREERFDIYFSLPDSFSTAITGFASGAKERVGYKKEWRQNLLTHSYDKPKGLHRVEEYIRLLELYTGKPSLPADVSLHHPASKQDHLIVNINSEAASRRLTVPKAVELLQTLSANISMPILLIGASKEKEFINTVLSQMNNSSIQNLAGKTDLRELVQCLASAKAMISTDSGPAHLANALGTNTVVLFGAGNENKTAPYNKEQLEVIRLGQLPCEPCEKNVCVRYETPQCLERLDTFRILTSLQGMLT